MQKQPTAPHYFTDAGGRRLVRLYVHGSDAPVVTEAALWDNAQRRHGLTGNLFLNNSGTGHIYVYATLPGTDNQHPLARLLLLTKPSGYRVRYIDKNPLNMLPENFRLDAPWADQGTAAEALGLLLDIARNGMAEGDKEAA